MCRRVTCAKCGRPSWAGCGAHVEQVLGNVPVANRCRCREEPRPSEAKAGGAIDKLRRFFKGRT